MITMKLDSKNYSGLTDFRSHGKRDQLELGLIGKWVQSSPTFEFNFQTLYRE